MRHILAAATLALLATFNVQAGRLDIAVIQFPEVKTPEELRAAFATAELVDLTNSNRTITTEPYLKGGYILFAQSLAANRNSSVVASLRIKDDRVDTLAKLGAKDISLSVSLMSGVKLGIRSFEKKVYAGTAALPNGVPTILSIRQTRIKGPKVIKDRSQVVSSDITTVVVAEYVP